MNAVTPTNAAEPARPAGNPHPMSTPANGSDNVAPP
jgi:hypothetical protein